MLKTDLAGDHYIYMLMYVGSRSFMIQARNKPPLKKSVLLGSIVHSAKCAEMPPIGPGGPIRVGCIIPCKGLKAIRAKST